MGGFADENYADWIGRETVREDVIAPRLIEHYRQTLKGFLAEAEVPIGLFWALCPDALGPDQLGRDGHPTTGIFLPALPLPRRMWAGGELRFHGMFRPGDTVTRISRIEKVASKTGSTGPLGFVVVRHHYRVGPTLILDERQDIVYREDPKSGVVAPPSPAPDLGVQRDRMELSPDPVLLFRYSALTFNGHRIHYDHPYATGVEGYDGLVVHGPLQAVLMLNLAARVLGGRPARFTYRGIAPLTAGKLIAIEAYDGSADTLDLRVRISGGPVTMTAQVTP